MDDPKIGVYLAIQNPHNAIQYGGTTVGPLVKEIMSESLSFLNVKKIMKEFPINQDYGLINRYTKFLNILV